MTPKGPSNGAPPPHYEIGYRKVGLRRSIDLIFSIASGKISVNEPAICGPFCATIPLVMTETYTMRIVSESPQETERLGERLGAALRPGDVLCLSGELGAGKTCLTRGLARGWGADARVTSPTFTLINEYRRPGDGLRFHHVDAYRLLSADDALTTGLDDVLDAPGVVAIEWPERIAPALPEDCLWVSLEAGAPGHRTLTFRAAGPRGAALLAALPPSED